MSTCTLQPKTSGSSFAALLSNAGIEVPPNAQELHLWKTAQSGTTQRSFALDLYRQRTGTKKITHALVAFNKAMKTLQQVNVSQN